MNSLTSATHTASFFNQYFTVELKQKTEILKTLINYMDLSKWEC